MAVLIFIRHCGGGDGFLFKQSGTQQMWGTCIYIRNVLLSTKKG